MVMVLAAFGITLVVYALTYWIMELVDKKQETK